MGQSTFDIEVSMRNLDVLREAYKISPTRETS